MIKEYSRFAGALTEPPAGKHLCCRISGYEPLQSALGRRNCEQGRLNGHWH